MTDAIIVDIELNWRNDNGQDGVEWHEECDCVAVGSGRSKISLFCPSFDLEANPVKEIFQKIQK